jgi:hypothetical protein
VNSSRQWVEQNCRGELAQQSGDLPAWPESRLGGERTSTNSPTISGRNLACPLVGDPCRLSEARRLTALDNCTYSEGIAEGLAAPDDVFDVVVSSLMIHHLPGTRRAWRSRKCSG